MSDPQNPPNVPYWAPDCRCGNYALEQVDMICDEAVSKVRTEIATKLRQHAHELAPGSERSHVLQLANWIEEGCP